MEALNHIQYKVVFDQETIHGESEITRYSKQDAIKKGLRTLGFCYLGAIITLFIPIVHFVATPGLLLIGPIVAFVIYRFYNGLEEVERHDIPCPKCGEKFSTPGSPSGWPFVDKCQKCGVKIEGFKNN